MSDTAPDNLEEDEILSAYLDGELPPAKKAAIDQRLENEPELKARLSSLATADKALAAAFELSHVKVPASVAALLQGEPNSKQVERANADQISSDANEPGEERSTVLAFPQSRKRTPEYLAPTAIAASIAALAGFAVGMQNSPVGAPSDAVQSVAFLGPLSQDHPLSAAFGEAASGEAVQVSAVAGVERLKPVLSFFTSDGALCREFLAGNSVSSVRGVACHDEGAGWNMRAVVASTIALKADTSGYETASAEDVALIARYVDGIIDSDPLDPEKERDALEGLK